MNAPPWFDVALAEARRGVFERAGVEDDPRIVEYHAATRLGPRPDEVPWCSSFVNWCVMRVGVTRTRSAAARSWLRWGVELGVPAFGCVVVLSRGGGPQPGPDVVDAPGHVGFYVGESGLGEILVLGGNQSDRVCVRPYPVARVLAYRWPGASCYTSSRT